MSVQVYRIMKDSASMLHYSACRLRFLGQSHTASFMDAQVKKTREALAAIAYGEPIGEQDMDDGEKYLSNQDFY